MRIAWAAVVLCLLVPVSGCGEDGTTKERSSGGGSGGGGDDMTHPEVIEAWDRGEYDPPVDMNSTDEEYVELLKAEAPDAFEYMDPQEVVRKAVGVCQAADPSDGAGWASRADAYEGSAFAEGIDPEVQFMVDEAFNYYCPEAGDRLQ